MIYNQKGSALLNAILVSTVVLITSGVIYQQSLETQRMNRFPRIKSTELVAETALKTWALQPSSYQNCGTGNPNCNIQRDLIEGRRFIVPGASCPAGQSPCGFVVENVNFFLNPPPALGSPGPLFQAFLRYEGTELSLARKEILLRIPPETLHVDLVVCPADTPIFSGFLDDGRPNCRSLPSTAFCPLGSYAEKVDLGNLTLECTPLTLNSTCTTDQVISSITWNNGSFQITCGPRMRAFTYHAPFSPSFTSTQSREIRNPLSDPEDSPRPPDGYQYRSCGPTPPPVAGARCGTAAGGPATNTAPTTDLCESPAIASTVDSTTYTDKHTWTCSITNPFSLVSCERMKDVPIVGECKSPPSGTTPISRSDFDAAPEKCEVGAYTNFGNPTDPPLGPRFTWQCRGNPHPANTVNCSAPELIPASCGTLAGGAPITRSDFDAIVSGPSGSQLCQPGSSYGNMSNVDLVIRWNCTPPSGPVATCQVAEKRDGACSPESNGLVQSPSDFANASKCAAGTPDNLVISILTSTGVGPVLASTAEPRLIAQILFHLLLVAVGPARQARLGLLARG